MSRGTWQGSGTWQTAGPDLAVLVVPAVLIGVGIAVMLEYLWYIIAALAAIAAVLVVSAVVVRRKFAADAARLEATREERHARIAAAERKPQVTQGTLQPVIVNNYGPHYHIYGADSRERPGIPVIRGRVISSKEERS